MSNLLQLQAGTKSFGTKVLFDAAQFAINEGEHVGVIGPNGAGKTTLFKILTGQETLDSGQVVKSHSLRIGYLAQHDTWTPELTVEDYLKQNTIMPLWELKSLSNNLGISEEHFAKPISLLSGGYRMRCKLLNLLGQMPNLMLLDEPTNYLDLETTLVLEEFLQDYKNAFLLISHDREFLQKTTDHILEIEQGEITKFNGNLEDYFEQKQMLREQLEAHAYSLQQKKEEILKFVARFGAKATKAKQAQSRLKTLAKMETVEVKALPISASIKIPEPTHTGKVILSVIGTDLGYGQNTVLKNIDYTLHRGDHVAIVGLNGAGKSTFLKALAQTLKPLKGQINLGLNVSIGYYAQHVAESLNHSSTVLDQMLAKAHPAITTQDALNMAGSLLFSGEDVKKKISVLSGGEKSRVALGQILLQRAPCLILDEPTNHLDFQTVEALTQALSHYNGTIVVVSHDRSFIRRIGKKIVEINNGQATVYPGTYDDYVWSLRSGALSQRDLSPQPPTTDSQQPSKEAAVGEKFNFKEAKKTLEKQLKACDKTLKESDENLKVLTAKLSELNLKIAMGIGDARTKAIQELGETQIKIETLEASWLTASELKEELEKKIRLLAN